MNVVRYRVIGPLVTVKTANALLPGGPGVMFQTIPHASLLPEDVAQAHIDHLLDMRMIEPVAPLVQPGA